MRTKLLIYFALSFFLFPIPAMSSPMDELKWMDPGEDGDGRMGSVLLDISHGFARPGSHPDSNYVQLQDLLVEMGHPAVVSDSGVLQLDLTKFEGIIINPAWAQDSSYTEEEASLFRDYVEGGGGLLIIADHPPTGPEINPVAQVFGTTTGVSHLPSPLFIINLADHPIFRGVDVIRFGDGGELVALPPSEAVAWDAIGRAAVVVVELGEGRVVIVGNAAIFSDLLTPFSANETFIRNIFLWILRLECTSFDDLDKTLAEAEINSHGVRNSLQSKANNARRQYKRGNLRASGNILCALLHEVDGQEGKHINPASSREIRECVQNMAEVLGIPLPCLAREEKTALVLEAFPNPFSASSGVKSTRIGYSLSTPTHTTLKIYDVTGRLVRTLIDERQLAERYSISWDGRDNFGRKTQTGIYFLRLTAGGPSLNRKLVLLK